MAKILRSEGIVLKAYNFRETSRIITFFSKDFGKLKLLAKGIRKPGSKFGASLELFTHSSVIFYKKETKEIYTLSDSHIIHSFDRLRSNLVSFILASNILNFLSAATPTEEPNPQLFTLSLLTFRLIEDHPKVMLLWGYLIKALALLGYSPELSRCIECKKLSTSTWLDIERGGIICEGCRGNRKNILVLSKSTMSILKKAQREPLRKLSESKTISLNVEEIDRFFTQFIWYHLNLEVSFRELRESWLFK